MNSFFEEYSRIIGLFTLTFVIIMLFSTPSMIIAKGFTTIGTELSYATEDETRVRTKLNFGNNEHIATFPRQIDDWTGSDYNTTGVVERLGADVMLMRAYSHPRLYQPVFFLIMQSNNRSSFHPLIVCYPALGYTIEEEGKEFVAVSNVSWAEEPWLSERDKTLNVTILVNKLVVVKKAEDGKIIERRVVLYFYVNNRPFTTNTVTMLRFSALAPIEGSYEDILGVTKEFMGDTIPYLFEMEQKEPVIFTSLASGSVTSKIVLIMLLITPLVIIFYPELRTIQRRRYRGE